MRRGSSPAGSADGRRTAAQLEASGRLGSGAAILLVALVVAACEHPGVPHPLAVAEGFPPPAELRVGLKDFEIDPKEIAARAGTIAFSLVNEGHFTHDFHVEGKGIDDHSGRIGAGRTDEWKITLPAGTYKVSCLVSNHAERGMTGTLVVTGP